MTDLTNEINESFVTDDVAIQSTEEIIDRFAAIHNMSREDAMDRLKVVSTSSPTYTLSRIEKYTVDKINSKRVTMNREQRRALKKKVGAKKYAEMIAEEGDTVEVIVETAKKLNYIDLIQKLKKINEENEKNGKYNDEED